MLIIRNKNPNSAERELIQQLEPLAGVAFIGYTVASGNKEREIDALVFTPVRATVIEVKAPQMGAPHSGVLVPYLNAPWTIDGVEARFYGGTNPNNQARVNAQIMAQFLKACNLEKTPFIQSAVVISGDELTMEKPKMLGQTAAGLTRHTLDVLDITREKALSLDTVMAIIDVLDLGPLTPSREAVAKEWEDAEALHAAIPKPGATKGVAAAAKKAVAPYPQESDKTSWQRWISKMADYAAILVATFLLVYFLDNIGAVDLVRHFPQQLWDYVTSPPPQGNSP